ncbi:MAG TPA: S8 family serine peptidase [Chitinophagaceae bacterium]|nr:S8 family serine peptidase [Chitinophagaceae bacterium]
MFSPQFKQRRFIARIYVLFTIFIISYSGYGQQPTQKYPEKYSPGVTELVLTAPVNREVRLMVMTKNTKLFFDSLIALKEIKVISLYEPTNTFIIYTPVKYISRVASWDHVLFMDRNRQASPELFSGTIENQTNIVNRMQAAFPAYNGNDITIGIKENAFDTADIDFKGRVLINPAATQAVNSHASIMATISAGGGNTWYATKAAAWGSKIVSSSFSNLLPDANSFFQQYGVTVQNHSYGTAIENYYGPEAVAYDLQVANNPSQLHVFSSGNSGQLASTAGTYNGIIGFANLTGQFKMAKNIITVGATDSFYNIPSLSSRGPAYDGRIKPELVAQGEDGSSGAAAIVSGVAAALQQSYKLNNGGNLPSSALIKAILINSANDVGPAKVDFQSGFGSVNGYRAMQTLVNGNYISGSVLPAQELTYNLIVPANTRELKMTLAWIDPPATVNAAKALVNDIDLELFYPLTSQTWQPWVLSNFPHRDSLLLPAVRKRDGLNTLEQITLDNPQAGTYVIKVKGFALTTASQSFHIAWQFNAANNFEWNYPRQNDPVLAGEQNVLRWQSTLATATGILQYSTDNGNSWQVINAAADLSAGFYKWIAPTVYSKALLKITAAGIDYTTDTVVISKRLTLSTGFNCPDSFMLIWPRVGAAAQYNLYKLGSKYMEVLQTLTDTSIVLQKNSNSSLHYAVAPVIGGREGVKSFGTNYTTQGVGCYFKSWYADQINNTGRLHLELGSLYNIVKITVQKVIGKDTLILQIVNNPNSLIYTFNDPVLITGLNQYRACLKTVNGAGICSDIAILYFAEENRLFVYPNPVRQSESFTVIINEQQSGELQVIDVSGRVLQKFIIQNGGAIQLPAIRLPAGLYMLRLAGNNLKVRTGKLIIY